MTFESLHSSGGRLHISDILSWKHMIGVAYILFSKDLQGSFQLRYFKESEIETEIKQERVRDKGREIDTIWNQRDTEDVEQLKLNS